MGGRGGAGGAKTAGGVSYNAIGRAQEMGANVWERGDRQRLYLNDAGSKIAGLEYDTYKSGNISYASYEGERISNAQGLRILGVANGAWVDLKSGTLHISRNGKLSDEINDGIESKIKRFLGLR